MSRLIPRTTLVELNAWIIGLTCTVVCGRADEIHLPTRSYRGVHFQNFDGEFVLFRSENGEIEAKALAGATALYADSIRGLEEFNRAESLFQGAQFDQAQKGYLAALPRTRGFWKDIVTVRYLMACDRAGDLDLAVKSFVELLQRLPEKADAYMPTNVTGATAEAQQRALELLQQALTQSSQQIAYWQLEALRLSILEHTESEEAQRVARGIVDELERSPNLKSRYRLQLIAVRVEVKHGQYDVALGHLDRLISKADEVYLPELLHLKGQCLFNLAQQRDDFIRAGLSFMRVVIHFPRSPFCAPSMFWCGKVHERIGRQAKAIQLYEDCQGQPGAEPALVAAAQEAAGRLRAGLGLTR